MLTQSPPLEGCGGVEGMEARPEDVATGLQHQFHHGGFLPLLQLRGCGHRGRALEVPPGGQNATQHRLSLIYNLRKLKAVFGLLPRLELLGVRLLDVCLEQVKGGYGDKGEVVRVPRGLLLCQHLPGPFQ